uniref:CTV.3 n=1 Tax=Poncirus trifoliata TaxID=37690 RepID=Q8H6S4_PONTR|nr:CTV.3 [Citrus trifoliata]
MDSNYTVIPKNSFLELQVYDNDQNPPSRINSHVKIQTFDEEHDADSKNFVDHVDNNQDDEHDDYPLISAKSNEGSGVAGAVFNLTTTVIGAGIMALPAAMKVLGLAVGFVLIIFMGILSEVSVELLVRFSVLCKATSYGEVVQYALGRPAKILSEICIILNNAGVLVVYLIIVGDVMSGSLHHTGVFDQWLGKGMWDHRKLLILIVLVVFLAPLCALDRIESLSMSSAASVALAVVFVVVCFFIAFIKLVEGKLDPPRMSPDFGSKKAILDLLVVIPIMTNAYVCHFNVQPIYNELEGRTPQKMNHVGRLTTILCIVVYSSTAISGYLLFGKDTESDVLTNFDKDLGIGYSTALNYIVRGSAPLLESRKRSLALTGVLLVLIYFGSTMIPSIWTAFKFTGATTAVSLGFIFPPLVALRLRKEGPGLSLWEKFLSGLMLVLAIVVSFVGVMGNIYSLESKSDD